MFDALVLSLPARHSTLRVRVWRTLKQTGCGVLRDGVYVLPKSALGGKVLRAMESEIASAGGSAMIVELAPKQRELSRMRRLFDRSADYDELVRRIAAANSPRALPRLERSFAALAAIDFFPDAAKRRAAEALAAFRRAHPVGEPRASLRQVRPLDPKTYQNRVWATRKNLWVDRLASAWLIKRFIDRDARFVWLDSPRERPKKAVGFDFDGAQFTHIDGRVTFEVLLASFGLQADRGLAAVAKAVHFLDVGGIPVADAKGLETLLRGAKERIKNDDALLAEATRIFEHLYSAYAAAAS
ncbi:MAG TPA: chromate resistance protein ChrB domain-containing protein [Burkholderiales bacterium]|jgi:hypothetical protein